MSKFTKALIFVFIIVFIDQFSKIWIKTNMKLGESNIVFDSWFKIHFIENEGMAFGWKFINKTVLSLFRIVAVGLLGWFLYDLTRKKAKTIVLISISMILAGAFGNILDSAFYGMFFTESTPFKIAEFTKTAGYEIFLHGSVVDMLYFPLFSGRYPDWFPFLGGDTFEFFRPVFNIADSAVTCGVILILLFRKAFVFPSITKNNEQVTMSNK